MEIRVIDNYTDLVSLETAWNRCLTGCNHAVFATWEWVSIWWKHFGNGRRLLVLVAEEGDQILGIAPLMLSVESTFGLHRSKLEFIGTPDSDYNSFIIRTAQANNDEILNSFVKYLNKINEQWTFLSLMEIPQNAECLPYFQKIAKMKQVTKCSYLQLPQSYEVFLKNLSYKQRGSVNNTINKIKKNFSAELIDYSSQASCIEGMHILIDLHQKRWAKAGLSGAFSDKRIENFHMEIAETFAKKNMLGLYILKFNGKPVSGTYGFKYASRYYAYLPGFDPEYSKFGVGSILVPYLVDKFIYEGLTEFDFMRGDEGYKERWNAISCWNYQAILYRQSFLGGFSHKLYDKFWRKGNNLKYLLRKF